MSEDVAIYLFRWCVTSIVLSLVAFLAPLVVEALGYGDRWFRPCLRLAWFLVAVTFALIIAIAWAWP